MTARSATFEDPGLVAARAGLTSVYMVSALVVLASCVITLRIPRKGDVS